MGNVRSSRAWALILILALLAGCAPAYLNQAKNNLSLPLEQRSGNGNPQTESFVRASASEASADPPLPTAARLGQAPSSGYFVGLSISGGGSRSANFAAACMFQLQRLGFLQKVQCISAVSGGALAASYYCLCTDAEWNPKNLQEKLGRGFESNALGQLFLPWNLIGLGFGTLTGSDLLAEEFSHALFVRRGRRLTFADLRRDRPRLLINCTDLETGRPFIFDNSTFDLINSNLDAYPLAYAVTASSAIPVVVEPVTLRDYSTQYPQFDHLVDGGVCDNLGVQALVNSYVAQTQLPNNPYPNGAILVIIDAGVRQDTKLNHKAVLGGIENMLAGLSVSSGVLLNRASDATLSELVVLHSMGSYSAEELRQKIDQLKNEHDVQIRDKEGRRVRVLQLSLAQMAELSDGSFNARLNGIATTFDITPDDAYALYKAAEILFRQRFDAKFMPLVEQLNRPATRPATAPAE